VMTTIASVCGMRQVDARRRRGESAREHVAFRDGKLRRLI
jgi:hypothetical protein